MTLQEANRLSNVIAKEKKSKRLLAKALYGFNRAEVDSRSIFIKAYWQIGRDCFAMAEDGGANAESVELKGDVATDIIKTAIDKLENSIDFHEKQLKEL